MSCMWVSVSDCNQSHMYHLVQMIKEDEELHIILSYGGPHTLDGENSSVSQNIEKLLACLGIPSHLKGWTYLKTALELSMADEELLDGITKRLYPDVAKRHHTSRETVEHAIRHAIEAGWKRGEEEMRRKVFGHCAKRPTNLEFLSRLVDYLRMGRMNGLS